MKIKLNISKDLKRDLKVIAKEKEMDRNDFIYDVIKNLLEEKEAVWSPKLEKIIEAAKLDGISVEEKSKDAMKKTTKKLQPIVLNVDENTYYSLGIVANKGDTTKEDLIINILKKIKK